MVVKVKVTTDFRNQAMKKAVKDANFTSLGRAGAFTRQVMRRSIRRRKKGGKPSAPGKPPKTTGPLKNAILWEMSQQKDDVAIGPTFGAFGTVGELHERGGTDNAPVVKKVRGARGRFTGERKITGFVTRRYPKRPFAVPALEKARPRLPKLWANSVKS